MRIQIGDGPKKKVPVRGLLRRVKRAFVQGVQRDDTQVVRAFTKGGMLYVVTSVEVVHEKHRGGKTKGPTLSAAQRRRALRKAFDKLTAMHKYQMSLDE